MSDSESAFPEEFCPFTTGALNKLWVHGDGAHIYTSSSKGVEAGRVLR